MINLYKSCLLLCFTVIIFGNCAVAQQTKSEKIKAYLQHANQLGLFNGNVLVVDQGQVIYKAAIGYADASKQIPLTTAYRFHIGSIAKEFDAVGLMVLQEQGKLSLDDKVSKFFPDLPSWANKISIKNLLQYTSGLPEVKYQTVHGDADNWKDLKALQQLDFEPGSKYAYNNNNTFLRRQIIEKISGLSIKDFIEQKLLKPYGIEHGIVDPTDNDTLVAKSFNDDGKQDVLDYPIMGWTCLNLDDFYTWAQCLQNFRIISPASTRAIITPVAPGKQSGLGTGAMNGDQLMRHVHDGIAMRYQAQEITDGPKNRTIILLTNNRHDNVYQLSDAIEAILDDKPYRQAARSVLTEIQKHPDIKNARQVLAFYKSLKAQKPDEYDFDNESTLNEIGYNYLSHDELSDAIAIFEYNVKLFPASGNVYDSLGEAYYKQGDKKNALLNYKRSLQLDPDNSEAKDIIIKLKQ
ncbi:serine hydrolase [Mucilaginibacter aquaedulcis]|uniref:serine hydrolase n=1 Tax=Mucilaginibacter aquaedulcis TaxID=1187081 RepID=UPI0025B59471|nr:serine hydrolase [Mucilaginibacter aquaedulcis]MDN3551765.1 serine hydrolase [Mucilaginibacter aquaedulcis]